MKKYSLLFLMTIWVTVANAQETRTRAHVENYRSWSIGINGGMTSSWGDLPSFVGKTDDAVPSEYGGFELGVRGHLTKFFNPTLGFRGDIGYHSLSGTRVDLFYEGNSYDATGTLLFNLSNWMIRGRTYDRRSAVLFGVGLGLSSSKSYLFGTAAGTGDTLAETGLVSFAGTATNRDRTRALQAIVPISLNYKYRLTNGLDLDAGAMYTFYTEDFIDGYMRGSTTDKTSYIYLGLTYNFGDADKVSVIYSNPLDDIFADVEEVKNNFDQLTTDDDKDGVNNFFDKENNTPEGVVVDGSGKATDVDQDGIPDYMDEDPFTAKGAKVDAQGRAVDSDGDGVADYMDKEPNTKQGALVNYQGKTIPSGGGGVGGAYFPSVYFAFNSATVTAANHDRLATVAMALKNNPNVTVTVIGHADSRGSEEYNKNLAKRRAEAVVNQLVQVYGIDAGRFNTDSEGETDPLASGRYDVNRRADFIVK